MEPQDLSSNSSHESYELEESFRDSDFFDSDDVEEMEHEFNAGSYMDDEIKS